jgi:N6-adenosine-specific RNA methylase IME4
LKFQVIVADPPYAFSDKLTMSAVKRGADAQYQGTLNQAAILALPVNQVAEKDSVLALWVPSTHLAEGMNIMKAWGFTYKQNKIWVKIKIAKSVEKLLKKRDPKQPFDMNEILGFGMGRLFRQTHEICLIGTKGKISKQLKNKSQRSVDLHPLMPKQVGKDSHSQKPETLQDELEIMFPGASNLELFARRERDKWITLGNEVGARQDIRDSLPELVKL